MSENQINIVHAEVINDRFDRIERKIDKLSDAMVSLARTEEKIMSMEADRATTVDRLNRHSERLDLLTVKVNDNTNVISNITKLFWAIAMAVITATITYFMA